MPSASLFTYLVATMLRLQKLSTLVPQRTYVSYQQRKTRSEPLDLRGIRRLWHVFFQGGNPDMAELLVRDHVELYLSRLCSVACYNPALFSRADMAKYVRAYSQPGALRAGFHYYRAALDEDVIALSSCTKKLTMPVRQPYKRKRVDARLHPALRLYIARAGRETYESAQPA